MVRSGVLLAVLVAVVTLQGVATQEPECGECDKSKCPPTEDCPGAESMDSCGCCSLCRRSIGQRCDLPESKSVIYGPCGDYLLCKKRIDISSSDEATCQCVEQQEVCGSDNITYPTVCHLLDQATNKPNISVQLQSPCLTKPVIKTPPMSSKRQIGGILVLDCEAVGYPVPSITWELYRPNGDAIKLPNDDSGVAVQVRGGPERHMVTGWVQIMKINSDNVGLYVCNAANSQGAVKATANITLFDRGVEEL